MYNITHSKDCQKSEECNAEQLSNRLFNRCLLLSLSVANTREAKMTGFSAVQEAQPDQIDVSGIFVDTAFRSTPWAQEKVERESSRTAARILFVSESNVCRSILAEAVTRQILDERGLSEQILCESKGTRQALCRQPLAHFEIHAKS